MNSIILPTYCPTQEVEEVLAKFLPTLLTNTALPSELIIVEQGKYVALDMIKNLIDPLVLKENQINQIYHEYFEDPIGYAKAVNTGVAQSRGEFIFIVNNDLEVPPHWDFKLLQAYNSDAKIGLISPFEHTKKSYPGILYNESWWSCVCISRKVWDEVGPLDDTKLNYRFHDQDWSIRCKMKGYEVCRLGTLQVKHIEQTTYKHMTEVVKKDEPEEKAEMIRRYGVAHFHEWLHK